MAKRLGLDAGGVLFIHSSEQKGEDTSSTQWMPGCLAALEKLSQTYELYVVSFAGQQRGEETKAAIAQEASQFFPEDHVHIVSQRRLKGIVCAELKLSVMVDDRLDVLNAIHMTAPIPQGRDNCQLIHFDPTGRTRQKPRYIKT